MDSLVLVKYQVRFKNEIYGGERFPKMFCKWVRTINDYLTELLDCWQNIDDIDEYLIPGLNEGETGSEGVAVYVKNNTAYFYNLFKPDFSNSSADYNMPLNDLM